MTSDAAFELLMQMAGIKEDADLEDPNNAMKVMVIQAGLNINADPVEIVAASMASKLLLGALTGARGFYDQISQLTKERFKEDDALHMFFALTMHQKAAEKQLRRAMPGGMPNIIVKLLDDMATGIVEQGDKEAISDLSEMLSNLVERGNERKEG